jgi:hypothetical protein
MKLSRFLYVVNATEQIEVIDYNTQKALYSGVSFSCPQYNIDVLNVFVSGGKMVIEVEPV